MGYIAAWGLTYTQLITRSSLRSLLLARRETRRVVRAITYGCSDVHVIGSSLLPGKVLEDSDRVWRRG